MSCSKCKSVSKTGCSKCKSPICSQMCLETHICVKIGDVPDTLRECLTLALSLKNTPAKIVVSEQQQEIDACITKVVDYANTLDETWKSQLMLFIPRDTKLIYTRDMGDSLVFVAGTYRYSTFKYEVQRAGALLTVFLYGIALLKATVEDNRIDTLAYLQYAKQARVFIASLTNANRSVQVGIVVNSAAEKLGIEYEELIASV